MYGANGFKFDFDILESRSGRAFSSLACLVLSPRTSDFSKYVALRPSLLVLEVGLLVVCLGVGLGVHVLVVIGLVVGLPVDGGGIDVGLRVVGVLVVVL